MYRDIANSPSNAGFVTLTDNTTVRRRERTYVIAEKLLVNLSRLFARAFAARGPAEKCLLVRNRQPRLFNDIASLWEC